MTLFTTTLTSKHCGANLASEEALLKADKPSRTLYLVFYENFPALVLGKSLDCAQEIWQHKIHPPVYRRISGGGSVMHMTGNLNYSLFLSLVDFPQFMNISLSYERILGALAQALGPSVSREGYSDLAIRCRGTARKFSGNAQCRKRGWIMHHGTLLYDTEAIRQIPWYLKPPPKEPEYRRGRRHRDFMTNILPVSSRANLMHRVRLAFAKEFAAELRTLRECELLKSLNLCAPAHRLSDKTSITPFPAERQPQ